jgi:hypothetical protein
MGRVDPVSVGTASFRRHAVFSAILIGVDLATG